MKRTYFILIFGVMLGVVLLFWVIPRSLFLSAFVEEMCPGVVPASGWARNLDSPDTDLVRESLALLAQRKNPVGAARAIELLNDPDDYVWLNAAHYLGACRRPEAVPYLIKALRHTAWHADPETTEYLRTITGVDFGTDFARWQQWWLASHPGFAFDWESHLGFAPRITEPK